MTDDGRRSSVPESVPDTRRRSASPGELSYWEME
jgi:hypothetical protein